MKKLVALAAVLAAVTLVPALPARAQGQGRRGMFPGLTLIQMPAPLQAKLKLTDDQKAKLQTMRDAQLAEFQAGQQEAQNGGDRQAIFQKIAASRQKADADALALLTADQKTQFEGMKKESAQY